MTENPGLPEAAENPKREAAALTQARTTWSLPAGGTVLTKRTINHQLRLRHNSCNVEKRDLFGMKPKRKSRESGSQVVEATFVIIPLLLMTFLMLDLSMVIFVRTTLQEAVREGCRFAVTGQLVPGITHQDDSIKWVVKKFAVGFLSSGSNANTIHVQFVNPANGGQGTNIFPNIVNVKIEGYKYSAMAPFERLNYPLYVYAQASDVMEQFSGAAPPLSLPLDQ
jgi:hypothetical protein